MIKKKTVVVVAAGASNDLGMPLGPDLQKRVAELLKNENSLGRQLRSAAHHHFGKSDRRQVDEVVQKAKSLSAQIRSAASIDNFLDQHRDDINLVEYLKMVIAYALAEAEQRSKISGRQSIEELITNNKDYFLFDFLNIVVRGHQSANLSESLRNLTFVIFNYDRCVERYIDSWMEFRFGADFDWRENGPTFIHVYGSLGDYFDPQLHNPFQYEGEFAFMNPHIELPKYVSRIKVFTEQEDSDVQNDIMNSVHVAETIAFFGFGFEEQNMRFFDNSFDNMTVFATLFGVSPPNAKHLQESLVTRFSRTYQAVHTVDGKSKKLISDFYFPLTSSVGSL